MQRLETSPNPLIGTADRMGGWLIEKIDGTKTPEQRQIELPEMSKADIFLTVGIIGLASLVGGVIDTHMSSSRNTLDASLVIGGMLSFIGGSVGKMTDGFEILK